MTALGGRRAGDAEACWNTGVRALRCITAALGRAPDAPGDQRAPALVTRADFEAALRRLAAVGARVPDDHDELWRAFAGMRAQYEHLLLTLADATMAPLGPWLPPS